MARGDSGKGYVRRIPISLFGVCLGTAGQVPMWNSLATTPAMQRFNIPTIIGQTFWIFSVVLLAFISFVYTWKILLHPRSVRTEFHCYYQSNFFSLPFLCLIILSVGLPPQWFADMPSPLLLLLLVPLMSIHVYLYGEWMYGVNRSLRLANPAFQLAIVGNFFAAMLSSRVGQHELALGFFAVGLLYLTLTLACLHAGNMRIKRDCTGQVIREESRRRLFKLDGDLHPVLESTVGRVQHNPWSPASEIWALPPGLQPTLFLCVAPPSVAALAWSGINQGRCDMFCKSLVSIAIFFLLTMLVHLHRFFRRTPFSLAVWAFTFPSAALGTSSMAYAQSSTVQFSYVALLFCCLAMSFWSLASFTSLYMLWHKGLVAFLSPGSEGTSDAHFMVRRKSFRSTSDEPSGQPHNRHHVEPRARAPTEQGARSVDFTVSSV